MNGRVRKWYSQHPEIKEAKRVKRVERVRNNPILRRKRNYNSKLSKRPYLRYRSDKCRRCNFIPEYRCQLTVDHIDRNKNNNNIDNLQTLCHNCHNLKNYIERFEPEKLLLLNLIPSTTTISTIPHIG
jgi:hypothetical protein